MLTEVGDALCGVGDRTKYAPCITLLRASPFVAIVPFSSGLFDRGIEFYASRPDKEWSLTDCISFVVMKERGLSEALTGDRHFQQAGFRPLLM